MSELIPQNRPKPGKNWLETLKNPKTLGLSVLGGFLLLMAFVASRVDAPEREASGKYVPKSDWPEPMRQAPSSSLSLPRKIASRIPIFGKMFDGGDSGAKSTATRDLQAAKGAAQAQAAGETAGEDTGVLASEAGAAGGDPLAALAEGGAAGALAAKGFGGGGGGGAGGGFGGAGGGGGAALSGGTGAMGGGGSSASLGAAGGGGVQGRGPVGAAGANSFSGQNLTSSRGASGGARGVGPDRAFTPAGVRNSESGGAASVGDARRSSIGGAGATNQAKYGASGGGAGPATSAASGGGATASPGGSSIGGGGSVAAPGESGPTNAGGQETNSGGAVGGGGGGGEGGADKIGAYSAAVQAYEKQPPLTEGGACVDCMIRAMKARYVKSRDKLKALRDGLDGLINKWKKYGAVTKVLNDLKKDLDSDDGLKLFNARIADLGAAEGCFPRAYRPREKEACFNKFRGPIISIPGTIDFMHNSMAAELARDGGAAVNTVPSSMYGYPRSMWVQDLNAVIKTVTRAADDLEGRDWHTIKKGDDDVEVSGLRTWGDDEKATNFSRNYVPTHINAVETMNRIQSKDLPAAKQPKWEEAQRNGGPALEGAHTLWSQVEGAPDMLAKIRVFIEAHRETQKAADTLVGGLVALGLREPGPDGAPSAQFVPVPKNPVDKCDVAFPRPPDEPKK